jgi:putative transposase
MSETYQSLSHSKWDCKYHVVFVPKRRRKAIFGQTRKQLGPIFHALAQQKECQIIEGHLMPDHVHMCIAIPPKHPVASVIGFLKGKSAIAMARLCGRERNFTGEHFWARGYAVSTVGFELEQVRTCRFALTSASRTQRMEQADSSELTNKARIARRLNLQTNRL